MKNRPTIKDIAAEVGVSHTTVSYILSGNTTQKISEATRKAVLDAARRLQYVPNGAARSLRNNSSSCIGVAMEKSIAQTRYGNLLEGIRNVLRAEGYGLMLFDFSSSDDLYPDYLNSVLQRRTDGVIYISSDGNPPPEEWRKLIIANNLPFVVCDCCPEEKELASVSFDYERGAFEIGCRLFGEGVKKLLYWRPDIDLQQEAYREQGLRRAAALYPDAELQVCYLPCDQLQTTRGNDRHWAFSQACRQNMAQDIIPRLATYQSEDAVVCSWGVMTKYMGAMLQGKDWHLRLASLSDSEIPIMRDTRILASKSDFLHGGEECIRLLLKLIRDEETPRQVIVPPTMPCYLEL